jgi:hypothetical protein
MKKIFSSRRHRYLARVSIFLIMVALIAGMVSCGGGDGGNGGGGSYTLTVNSTAGGVVAVNNVTIPGKTMFIYAPGTVVSLNATPDVGYCFAKWTGNVSTVANVTAAITTITMNGDYSITANFALEIWDWYDLNAVRNNLTGSYLLMNDLDSTTPGYEELASLTANGGKGWQPIGNRTSGNFTGSFDGQGHEIQDLYINRSEEYRIGLFRRVGEGGAITNIRVIEAAVTGDREGVGILVAINAGGTVSNCYATGCVTGSVIGNGTAGGLVALNLEGTVSNSYYSGSVTGSWGVGGLVGINNDGTVSNCYATGNVGGNYWVGGLVGCNAEEGTIDNCYSTGSVTGNFSLGGLVGYAYDGTVSYSFWDTQTSGQNSSAGGTGKNTTEMQNITTFSGATWNITTVGGLGERNPAYIWNIVDSVTYPFLSWQP